MTMTDTGRRGAASAPAPVASPPETTEVSCVICTTPRSGSWLLAEALTDTGLAGRPEEYLRPDWYARFRDSGHLRYQHRLNHWPDGPPRHADGTLNGKGAGYRSFLDAVRSIGTVNGVFAIKIHRNQLDTVLEHIRREEPGIDDVELIYSWLPTPRFIFLRRRDAVRRAVSHYRALQTGVWWSYGNRRRHQGGSTAVDPEEIHRLVRNCVRQEQRWMDFFRRAGVTPLPLTYEELTLDLPHAVADVLGHLGVEPARVRVLPPPKLIRQADAWTEAAVHRYVTWLRMYRPLTDGHYGFDAVTG
jgi:LPS sulfotransferase NodH